MSNPGGRSASAENGTPPLIAQHLTPVATLLVPLPAEDLDLMTRGTVLAILMALGHMARVRVGRRVARPLRKGGLDHTNQIRTTGEKNQYSRSSSLVRRVSERLTSSGPITLS